MTLRATIDSEIRIPNDLLPTKQITALEAGLSYDNPAYTSVSKKFSRRMEIPPMVSTLRKEHGFCIVPRGAVDLVRNLGIALDDQQLSLPSAGFRFIGTLREYQESAVEAAVQAQSGIIVAPCGAGKTTIALGIIARANQPALILVNSLDLLEQWNERVQAHLGISSALCSGGRFEIGPVSIATVQTARDPERLASLRDRFGLVLLDECHHAPAQTFASVMSAFPARFRLGVTATPSRADGLDALITQYIGPIIHVVQTNDLVETGHLVRPNYMPQTTNFTFAYSGPSDWQPLLAGLITSPERNQLIADSIAAECATGIVGLVLTGRVTHAEILRELLLTKGLRVALMTGGSSKTERAEALERARHGEIDVIVATQLADEGLDVPRLARLFLCFPGRSETQLLQRIGRIMRPHADKTVPAVIDFVDGKVGVLANQAKKRAEAFAML
jgi:superfamily II DNA or RNA helicase